MKVTNVIELIKRYLMSILVMGGLIIGIIGNTIYHEWQSKQIQLATLYQENQEDLQSVTRATDVMQVGVHTVDGLQEEEKAPTVTIAEEVLPTQQPIKLVPTQVPIYICGQVEEPGVYYVLEDAIINDIIQLSGGFTREADVLAINLASPITPHQKIIVPKKGENIGDVIETYNNVIPTQSTENVVQSQKKIVGQEPTILVQEESIININTANKEQLMSLPGIGEVKAMAIITYRQEQGYFSDKSEIQNVSGVGEKTYEKLASLIAVK